MIDKELHTALFELEKNLNDIKSAKQQIDEIKAISTNVISGIDNLKDKYSKHLKELEKNHEKTIDKIEISLLEYIDKIEKKIDFLIKKQENYIKQLKDKIDNSIKEHNKLLNKQREIFNEHNEIIQSHLKQYEDFKKEIQELLDYFKSVNFPERLDKIDNNITSINIGIQNLQGSISDINRDLNKNTEKIENQINEMYNKLSIENEKISKKSQMYFIMLVVLIILGILIVKFV